MRREAGMEVREGERLSMNDASLETCGLSLTSCAQCEVLWRIPNNIGLRERPIGLPIRHTVAKNTNIFLRLAFT